MANSGNRKDEQQGPEGRRYASNPAVSPDRRAGPRIGLPPIRMSAEGRCGKGRSKVELTGAGTVRTDKTGSEELQRARQPIDQDSTTEAGGHFRTAQGKTSENKL